MYLTEEDALQGICRKKINISFRPQRLSEIETQCVGSKCIAYWKWVDFEKKIGYCSVTYETDIPIEDQVQLEELRAKQKIITNKEKPCNGCGK